MWISTAGLWPGRSGAESLSVQAQAGPRYTGGASHTRGVLVSQRKQTLEHQVQGVDISKGAMRVLGRGALSASARELHRVRPAKEKPGTLVPSRRGRGSHVGAETEEREEQRERDWEGGENQLLGGKKAQGHILGKAGLQRSQKADKWETVRSPL